DIALLSGIHRTQTYVRDRAERGRRRATSRRAAAAPRAAPATASASCSRSGGSARALRRTRGPPPRAFAPRGPSARSASRSPHVLKRQLVRRLRGRVLNEVAELRVVLLPHRLLERHRELPHALDVLDLLDRPLERRGHLARRRLATELLHQLPLRMADLVQLL